MHHNAVRQHLAKLVEAELVVQDTMPSRGRGRPRLCYSLHPSAASRWGATGPYERLSLLLSEVIRTGDSPVEVGRRAARRHRLGTAPASDPVNAFVVQIAREGFEPTVDVRDNAVEVVLGCCPFATTALADPDTVCGLHLGMAYGAAEQSGGLVVDELLPEDPRRAQCRLRCHLVAESVA